MLGPTKWRLLTIVAGILLAHAIDSPVRSPRILSRRSSDDSQLALSIQRLIPLNEHYTRNLYPPYERFSSKGYGPIASSNPVRFRNGKTAFDTFRYYTPTYNDMSRRYDDMNFQNSNTTSVINVRPTTNHRKYIPLIDFTQNSSADLSVHSTKTQIQSRTDISQADAYQHSDLSVSSTNKVIFPFDPDFEVAPNNSELKGRRSGIQFTVQSQKLPINTFVPQGYREDNPNNPNFQLPYSEELSPIEPIETRLARGVSSLTGDAANPKVIGQQQLSGIRQLNNKVSQTVVFRDDVTKFGDVNGPITSTVQQRQYNDPVRIPYENNGAYYPLDDFVRSPRQYFPPKSFVEYSEYPGPPRNRLQTGWKSSRTPRVVFPQGDTFPTGPSGSANNYNIDNVVFRFVEKFIYHILTSLSIRKKT